MPVSEVQQVSCIIRGGCFRGLNIQPSTTNPITPNEFAHYYRYELGLNIIPANGKEPKVNWKQFQDKPIPEELHNFWKKNNAFDSGIQAIPGKVWHNPERTNLNWFALDIDNQLGIDELLASIKAQSLEEVAQKLLVVQHGTTKHKCHIYGYCTNELKKRLLKSTDNKNDDKPIIEIKDSSGLITLPQSTHPDGSTNRFIGTLDLAAVPVDIEAPVLSIYQKYDLLAENGNGIQNKERVKELFRAEYTSIEGFRHKDLITITNSLIARNHEILTDNEIRDLVIKWNNQHCASPLPDAEVDSIWKSCTDFQAKSQDVLGNEFKSTIPIATANEQRLVATNHSDDKDKGRGKTASTSISVLEAKRIHQGYVSVRGKIVTISERYIIETVLPPNNKLYRDAKFIQLEDIERLNENERLDVILYDDMIENVIAGEVVDIEGDMLIENKNNSKYSKKKIGVLHSKSIRYVNRRELLITFRHIESFERFVKYPSVIERLISMFAPNVIGHEDVKLGLLRSIVGGDDHGQIGTGRINTFLVGDPGTAKSTLGNEATKIKLNARHVSAPHASSKTITAIVDKENDSVTLRLGAIPLASHAICSIDEITAFPPEEQARLLDVLQEGILDVDKHGRHFKIPAPTTIIATANPIQSRWTAREVFSNDEVSILKTLLDRFQQTYGFRDDMNEEQTHQFTTKISSKRKRRPHNYEYLRSFLIYASAIKIRSITPEAEFILNDFWEKAKLQGTLSIRMYRGLYNIAEATAKLHLKDMVDAKIAIEALESVRLMMVEYGETVKIPPDPRIATYEECLKKLQNNHHMPFTIRSLFEMACEASMQIAKYIGSKLSMDQNKKIKVVVDMLRNHSQVKEVNNRPVMLQWIGQSESRADSDSDHSDHSDPKIDLSESQNTTKDILPKPQSVSDRSDRTESNYDVSFSLMLIHKTSQLLKIMQYIKTICVGCNNIIFVEKNSRIDHMRTCPGVP